MAAFETWFRHYDRSKPRFDIILDTGERIEGVYFAIVSKTSPYTYLGPRPLVVDPEAGLHTALALTAFRSLQRQRRCWAARRRRWDRASTCATRRGIVQRHDLRELRVEGRGPFPYQADGDDLGDVENLDIDYEDDTLTVVLP